MAPFAFVTYLLALFSLRNALVYFTWSSSPFSFAATIQLTSWKFLSTLVLSMSGTVDPYFECLSIRIVSLGTAIIQLDIFSFVVSKVPDEEASQTKAFNYLWNTEVGCGLRGFSDPEAVVWISVCGICVVSIFNFGDIRGNTEFSETDFMEHVIVSNGLIWRPKAFTKQVFQIESWTGCSPKVAGISKINRQGRIAWQSLEGDQHFIMGIWTIFIWDKLPRWWGLLDTCFECCGTVCRYRVAHQQ